MSDHVALRSAATAALACLALAAPAAAASPAAPGDDAEALASAFYGPAEIWLQRKPEHRRERELVFRSAEGAAPRVLDIRVPAHNRKLPSDWSERLALGLDGHGRLTVVMTARRGLYRARVKDGAKPRRIRHTSLADSYPSLFRGRLAFAHEPHARSSVRVGTLGSGPQRTVWSDRESAAVETAIGRAGAVAFVTAADGAEEGLYDAELATPAGRIRDLWPGDRHNGGISLELTPNGRRLTVAVSAGHRLLHYRLPGGRRLP
jgi:hypothetical protein